MVLDLAKFISNTSDYTQPPAAVVTVLDLSLRPEVSPNNIYRIEFDDFAWPVWTTDIVQTPMSTLREDITTQHFTVVAPVSGDSFANQRAIDGVTVWPINVQSNQVPLANGLIDVFQFGIDNTLGVGNDYNVRFDFNQPRMWQGYDLAEILFSFLVWNTGATTDAERDLRRDLLSFTRLERYSIAMAEPHTRQLFSIIRKIGTKLNDQWFGLVQQSYGMITWDDWFTGGMQSKLGVVGHTTVQENTNVIDLDIGETSFETSRLTQALENEEYVFNALELRYGGGVMLEGTYAPVSADPEDLFNAQGGDNVINLDDFDSQDTFGVRQGKLDQEDVTDQISLDGDYNFGHYVRSQLEINWAHGLPAFDYNTGEIVHIKNAEASLNGTEDILVLEKEIDLDTMITSAKGIVRDFDVSDWAILPTDYPSDRPTIPELQYWFRGDQGITSGGDGTAVTQWDDQGIGVNDAVSSGVDPIHRVADLNGKDTVDFNLSTSELAITNANITSDLTNVTCIALINPTNPNDGTAQSIWGFAKVLPDAMGFRMQGAAPVGNNLSLYDGIDLRDGEIVNQTGWQIVVFVAYADKVYTWTKPVVTTTVWGTDGASVSHVRRYMMDGTEVIDSHLGPREGNSALGQDFVFSGRADLDSGGAGRAILGNEGPPGTGAFGLRGKMAELQLWAHFQNARQFSNQEINGLVNDIRSRWGL